MRDPFFKAFVTIFLPCLVVAILGSVIALHFALATPAIDPACRDIEAKYQKLLQDEGPDAQPAIATKAQDEE